MKVAIFIIAAIASYLISGINPAIVLSKLIYKKDIREVGSGNPGFTNFNRAFGFKVAVWVMILDLLKGVVLCVLFGWLFTLPACGGLPRVFGVAYAGVFALIGHAYPVWYDFKGGKGFLVCLSTAWLLDWRAGLIATALMCALLFTIHYMSLATLCGLTAGAVTMLVLNRISAASGLDTASGFMTGKFPLFAVILYALCVVFVFIRHRANIVRLFKGTESKFSLKHKK